MNKGDELIIREWGRTPWIVNAHTECHPKDRFYLIRAWLEKNFGKQRPGKGFGHWQYGGATINGWTWIGFDTEERMNQFIDAWGTDRDE